MAEPRILDIGTGSGNIAVAVASRHEQARVTAVDLSTDAIAVAARNAANNSVGGRVRLLTGDLFAPIPPGERFDFVLSNPPYIAHEDLDQLPAGVRQYEPQMALDGGPGGYAVFHRLVSGAKEVLVPGGYLVVEIAAPQEMSARQYIQSHSGYELAETIYDGSHHPRVLCARWQP
jgi:release factor glutamine methyltransferase